MYAHELVRKYVHLEAIDADYLLAQIGRATIEYLTYFELSDVEQARQKHDVDVLSAANAIILARVTIAYWQGSSSESLSDVILFQIMEALGFRNLSARQCRELWNNFCDQHMRKLAHDDFYKTATFSFYPTIMLVCCIADMVQTNAIAGTTLGQMIQFPGGMRQRYKTVDVRKKEEMNQLLLAIGNVGILLRDCNVLQPEAPLDKEQYVRLFANHLPELMQKARQEKAQDNFVAAKKSYAYILGGIK